MKYDFSGWATRNDLQCSDGRIIRKDAFKHNDGQTVPLVWNHQHNDPMNILGHALLENRDDGVYAYCTLNDTEAGNNAKELILHGDVTALSIYANKLKQQGADVLHGAIREVSLVLAGANPGAFIDDIAIAHGDDDTAEAIIYTDEMLELAHSDDSKDTNNANDVQDEKTVEDVFNELTDEQKDVVYALVGQAIEDTKQEMLEQNKETNEDIKHSKDNSDEEEQDMPDTAKEKTVGDILDELTEEQKNVVYALIGQAIEDANNNTIGNEDDEEKEDAQEGEETMKHNLFENDTNNDALCHAAMETIITDAKRIGSLRDSYLAHADEYGITNIDYLFPDAQNLSDTPGFIRNQPEEWVTIVMNGVHHTPFSRVKMLFADLREDQARAKGYTKGKLKKEEVFALLKRTVEPTTVYKKQKLDRDDVIDITDFDVVAWLKGEMRTMLDEELARAFLFGDGRTSLSEDKISETNIIPICNDAALYTIQQTVTQGTDESLAHAIITSAVKGQVDYEGSGNTMYFTTSAYVTEMLLLEDKEGRRIYKDLNELALAIGVNKIVRVPASVVPEGIYGVIVDLADYNVGADKGGSVNMFDDFDIDYNRQKYLIETRCSGALVKPYSAIVLKAASSSTGD